MAEARTPATQPVHQPVADVCLERADKGWPIVTAQQRKRGSSPLCGGGVRRGQLAGTRLGSQVPSQQSASGDDDFFRSAVFAWLVQHCPCCGAESQGVL